jgi:hypothetical protein
MAFNIISDLLPPRHAISSEEYVELLEFYGSKYLIEVTGTPNTPNREQD